MTNSVDATMPPDERPDPPAPPSPLEFQPLDFRSEIADKLRQLYSEIEREPIPDKLLDLLEKLDEAEAKSKR